MDDVRAIAERLARRLDQDLNLAGQRDIDHIAVLVCAAMRSYGEAVRRQTVEECAKVVVNRYDADRILALATDGEGRGGGE